MYQWIRLNYNKYKAWEESMIISSRANYYRYKLTDLTSKLILYYVLVLSPTSSIFNVDKQILCPNQLTGSNVSAHSYIMIILSNHIQRNTN